MEGGEWSGFYIRCLLGRTIAKVSYWMTRKKEHSYVDFPLFNVMVKNITLKNNFELFNIVILLTV